MQNIKNNWFCFVAGDSSGHVLPAIELARRVKASDNFAKILFFSTDKPLDKKNLSVCFIIDKRVELSFYYFKKRGFWGILFFPLGLFQFFSNFIIAFFYFLRNRPVNIYSTGGLVSIPVCIAGWFLRIPITVYELNAERGRAVRVLSHLATEICFCFEGVKNSFPQEKSVKVDYPIRFIPGVKISKSDARKNLGIALDSKVVFIIGGSQGSLFLNKFIKGYFENFFKNNLVVLHQLGSDNLEFFKKFYKSLGLESRIFSYISDISDYYLASDLVIARAGAGTLFELVFFDKRACIVPLEVASTSHQVKNALDILKSHPKLFKILRQSQIKSNPDLAYRSIDELISRS